VQCCRFLEDRAKFFVNIETIFRSDLVDCIVDLLDEHLGFISSIDKNDIDKDWLEKAPKDYFHFFNSLITALPVSIEM
jgi:hypothetical protein